MMDVLQPKETTGHVEVINIDTGQHYDPGMSKSFIEDFGLTIHYTTKSIPALKSIVDRESPDFVLIYGDTHSTVLGLLASQKFARCHIEAGMRSHDERMTEEICRIMADHICDINFTSSRSALKTLNDEGLFGHFVGDIMYDSLLKYQCNISNPKLTKYIYVTCHRAENVDNPEQLRMILDELDKIDYEFVLPLHHRLIKRMKEFEFVFPKNITAIKPLSYSKNIDAIGRSQLVITDSGGIQKEAYWLGIPCITLRKSTEWTETIESGWNVLSEPNDLGNKINEMAMFSRDTERPEFYGGGFAALNILNILRSIYDKR